MKDLGFRALGVREGISGVRGLAAKGLGLEGLRVQGCRFERREFKGFRVKGSRLWGRGSLVRALQARDPV